MGVVSGRRRFLNLIVASRSPGVKSLRRINLSQLFHRATPPPPPTTKMEMLRLPRRDFTFRNLNNGWDLNCFPFAGSKVICGDDQSGFGFIFDLDSRKAATMPPLPKLPTANPVSVFAHRPHIDDDIFCHGNGSTFFLMERIPHPEPISNKYNAPANDQFVGFVNHYPSGPWGAKCFTGRLLPPPPFVRETSSWYKNTPRITASGVVGGGSHVCISVHGVGTYCLDTADHTWSKVGQWILPFHGKVEYVPELKLWFGLSAAAAAGVQQHLAAADLSDVMNSQPQLVGGPWKELVHLPDEWKECRDPQFVNLGSVRFCIARFFFQEAACSAAAAADGHQVIHENVVAVLTGVEVKVNCSGEGDTAGKVELQMTPHRSRRVNNSGIETLF